MLSKFSISTFICFVFIPYILMSQVSVQPLFVLLDKEKRSSIIELINPTDETREFKVELKFAYPKYFDDGTWDLIYDDTLLALKYSLTPYLKLFPSKLIIPPKEKQMVRLILKEIPEIEDKTLWTRFIVSSEPVTKQIDTTDFSENDTNLILPKIVLKTQMIGLINYRHGEVTATVDFNFLMKKEDSLNSVLIFSFEKGGNSPFLGKYILKIYDNNNNILINRKEKISIYESCKQSFKIDKSQLKRGKLKVELTINNEQEGLSEELRIPFKPVTKTYYIEN